jgi:hypothetical protein
LTTIISGSSIIDLLTGEFLEELLTTIVSQAGAYDYYKKPGMAETTIRFYVAARQDFEIDERQDFFVAAKPPSFIMEKTG